MEDMSNQQGLVGFFDDEVKLLEAAKKVQAEGYEKFDTISPFPIHGMDEVMKLKRSPVPWVTMVFGTIGCCCGVLLQWWTSAVSWPLNVGGKPLFSLPAFVPIIFEVTVLFAGLATFGAVLIFCKLPKINVPVIEKDLSSHRFALYILENDKKYDENRSQSFLRQLGACDVKRVSV